MFEFLFVIETKFYDWNGMIERKKKNKKGERERENVRVYVCVFAACSDGKKKRESERKYIVSIHIRVIG